MGQRHQVYLQLAPVYYNEGNPNNRGVKVVTLHHQWLYGGLPLRTLLNVIKMNEADKEYSPFFGAAYKAQDALNTCYSIDNEGRFIGSVSDNKHAIEDPRLGDNNDGITIIKITPKGEIKYCFMAVHERMECEKEVAPFVPLSALDYLSSYYDLTGEKAPLLDLVRSIDCSTTLLTLDEVKEMFPKMFLN